MKRLGRLWRSQIPVPSLFYSDPIKQPLIFALPSECGNFRAARLTYRLLRDAVEATLLE